MIAWWYADGDRPRGPLDGEALTRLFQEGRVSLQTEVWHEGMRAWTRIASIPQLRQLLLPPAEESEAVQRCSLVTDPPALHSYSCMFGSPDRWLWQISFGLAAILIFTGGIGLIWSQWQYSAKHPMPVPVQPSNAQTVPTPSSTAQISRTGT